MVVPHCVTYKNEVDTSVQLQFDRSCTNTTCNQSQNAKEALPGLDCVELNTVIGI